MDDPAILTFEEFELDHRRGELRRNGLPVQIEPQMLDLITHLAQNAGTVVDRDVLIEALRLSR